MQLRAVYLLFTLVTVACGPASSVSGDASLLADAGAIDGGATTGDAGSVDQDPPDAGVIPDQPCGYSAAIQFVDPSVSGDEPCGPADGTCVSGRMIFGQIQFTLSPGDVGEVYLFGSLAGAPFYQFRQTSPPEIMPFKLPNIPSEALAACTTFHVSGRLDVGGNNQGRPGGPEDPRIPDEQRIKVLLVPGTQINGIELELN